VKDPFEAQSRGPGSAGDATAGERTIASLAGAGHRFTGGQIPTLQWGPASAPRSDTAVAVTWGNIKHRRARNRRNRDRTAPGASCFSLTCWKLRHFLYHFSFFRIRRCSAG